MSHSEQPVGRPGAVLAAAVLGMFMVTLDAVIVNVTLPTIRHDLGGGITGLQWVVDGYTLMFAALLLSSGVLSDRVGARRAFGLGLAVFALSSAGCSLAPSLSALIAARFVQGSAAAVLMPSSMALVRQAYPESARRARAVAIWAMGGALASSAGPVLGGVLTLVNWRLIFFINLPAALAAIALLARSARSPRRAAPFDIAGQTMAVVGMGALTYGAIQSGAEGVTPPVVLAFVVAVVAIGGFLIAQSKGSHPMLALDLFRSRDLSVSSGIGFAFMVGYYGLPFVMSLYLQEERGISPLMTGVAFLPMMLSGVTLTPFSARLAERHGAKLLVTTGLLTMTAGLVVLSAVTSSAPTAAIAALMILVGLGGPLVMPPVTAMLLDSVPAPRAGTASGVFNTSRQIGGALAVAAFGALLGTPGGFATGLRASLLIAAVITAAAALASRTLRSVPGLNDQHVLVAPAISTVDIPPATEGGCT